MTKKYALKDYSPYPWQILAVDLDFHLDETKVIVSSTIRLKKKPAFKDNHSIFLDGKKLKLQSVTLNGTSLCPDMYIHNENGLCIETDQKEVEVKTVCEIYPDKNTELEGLYLSNGMFVTQCEAEGFRCITFFPDRPDCICVFTCKITADKKKYPVLLSNGNLVKKIEHGDSHSAIWEDPFPKPSYLFALVAGNLIHTEDFYVTNSNKKVALRLYTEKVHKNRHAFALESLKKAMRWDEDVYALEYDLDIFMIVAVDHFNFGAMENKGLNVFNSQTVLVDNALTTDIEKIHIEAIIAHEYFHNWTGNRVTLKNWFNLTLKEGLTVFRDQEFTADIRLGSVKRIEDVEFLHSVQFPEDAGPLAHPPIPESYVDINNFYTSTVYNKGAEVVRMLQTILGRDTFIGGVQSYLSKFDGKSATVEDFIGVMEGISGINLSSFLRWYYCPGTPKVTISSDFNPAEGRLNLEFSQSNPTAEKHGKHEPFMIPIKLGFIGKRSLKEIGFSCDVALENGTYLLTEKKKQINFDGFTEQPLVSVNRDFSAPVHIDFDYDNQELALLAAHDTNEFNRRQCIKQLIFREIKKAELNLQGYKPSGELTDVMRSIITSDKSNAHFRASCLRFPKYSELLSKRHHANPETLVGAYNIVYSGCFKPIEKQIISCYLLLADELTNVSEEGITAFRELKNTLLEIITRLSPGNPHLALKQYETCENITDRFAAMRLIVTFDNPSRCAIREDFYARCKHYNPMFYNWCRVVAGSEYDGVFDDISEIMALPEFHINNPNCVHHIVSGLTGNMGQFHLKDGTGYRFLKEMVFKMDPINPSLAAIALAKRFNILVSLDTPYKTLCLDCVQEINDAPGISPIVKEVTETILNNL